MLYLAKQCSHDWCPKAPPEKGCAHQNNPTPAPAAWRQLLTCQPQPTPLPYFSCLPCTCTTPLPPPHKMPAKCRPLAAHTTPTARHTPAPPSSLLEVRILYLLRQVEHMRHALLRCAHLRVHGQCNRTGHCCLHLQRAPPCMIGQYIIDEVLNVVRWVWCGEEGSLPA